MDILRLQTDYRLHCNNVWIYSDYRQTTVSTVTMYGYTQTTDRLQTANVCIEDTCLVTIDLINVKKVNLNTSLLDIPTNVTTN